MERLFVYGSLQPGGSNAHELAEIDGEWESASIRGRLLQSGWGAPLGYPALVLDCEGAEVSGYLLSSGTLRDHWKRLDEFEGDEYERVDADVRLQNGDCVQAQVYVLREEQSG